MIQSIYKISIHFNNNFIVKYKNFRGTRYASVKMMAATVSDHHHLKNAQKKKKIQDLFSILNITRIFSSYSF